MSSENNYEKLAEKFSQLFIGGSMGTYDPVTGKHFREKLRAPNKNTWFQHLKGSKSIGIMPIIETSKTWWGCIDIDAHGKDESIDLMELEKRVREISYPLVVCRSKSGGAHAYVFFDEPTSCAIVRKVLKSWSEYIGYPGSEVFPKQDTLTSTNTGSWLNMPYFDDISGNTNRFCVKDGKIISSSEFIEFATNSKIDKTKFWSLKDNEDQAPPCISTMLKNKVTKGNRNSALFQVAIYLKRAYDDWEQRTYEKNLEMFDHPLSSDEASKIIGSVKRTNYNYKCKDSPMADICKPDICLKRKFGIEPSERAEIFIGEMPIIKSLTKILTVPPRWLLEMDGKTNNLVLDTKQLMNYSQLSLAALDQLSLLMPPMKQHRWLPKLNDMMKDLVLVDAPEDASDQGLVWGAMWDYISQARLQDEDEDILEYREDLTAGSPIILYDQIGSTLIPYAYFRSREFESYLSTKRLNMMKQADLWQFLRSRGVNHKRMRLKSTGVIPVWYVQISENRLKPIIEKHELIDM